MQAGFEVDGGTVIQASKLESRIMRDELTDHEWAAIRPMLPKNPRGIARVTVGVS
jgi:hypothetical protein